MRTSLSPLKIYNFILMTLNIGLLSACTFEATMTKTNKNTTPPATSGAPSVTISSMIGTSNQTSVPISGECPSGSTSVNIQMNSNIINTINCSNGLYNGSLDLSSMNEGSIHITVAATTGSTDVSLIKDTIPPTPPSGLSVSAWSNSISQTPSLSWVNSTDLGTGILKYQARIIKASDSSEISTWQDLANGNLLSGLSLTQTTSYKFELRAQDGAGNISTLIQSSSWTVDTLNPVAPSNFSDGILSFSTTNSPNLSWLTGSDADSGVQGYQVAIGTSNGGTDILNWMNTGDILTTALNSLNLNGSTKYFASLRTIDNAGNSSSTINGDSWYNLKQNKFAIDTTNPRPRWLSEDSKFGTSTALSEDGQTLVVGAPYDNYDANMTNYTLYAGAVFVYIKSGGTWQLQQKLVALGTNARGAYDYFGTSVAISGDTIVAGAPWQNYDATGAGLLSHAGAAYVFKRTAGVWSQQQKLIATGTNARMANDSFGSSVAISGDTVIVGAYAHDYNALGAVLSNGAGAAFVFTRSADAWTQQQKLVAEGLNTRNGTEYFGASVSIYQDSIAVGCQYQDYDEVGGSYSNDAGAAFVYTRSAGVWSLQQKLVATGLNSRHSSSIFGVAVKIYADTVAVGAPGQAYDVSGATPLSSAGAVFVFTRSGSTWTQQQKIIATGLNARNSFDEFGSSLDLNDETLVAGTYYHSYDQNGNVPLSQAGTAFVFTRSAGLWSLQQKVTPSGTNSRLTEDQFAKSITLSGNTLVVGVPLQDFDENGLYEVTNAGASYAFSRSGGTWSQDQKIVETLAIPNRGDLYNSYFGTSTALSEDGLTLVVGAPYDSTDESFGAVKSNTGAAFVYIKSSGSWVFQQKLVATGVNARIKFDYFGSAVSISNETIAIGAPEQDFNATGGLEYSAAGAVYVFTRTAGVWTQQQKIVPTGTQGRNVGDAFGKSLAISGDTLVVGSKNSWDLNGANYLMDAGAAFVFTRTGSTWSQQQKLVGLGSNARIAFDLFGNSVALSGETIAIGASGQEYDNGGGTIVNNSGAVYVFTRTAGVWTQQQKIVQIPSERGSINEWFGSGVALSGNTLAIGAGGNDYDINSNYEADAGAVYVFTRTGTLWTQEQKITPTGANARFTAAGIGENLALNNETLVIGSTHHQYDTSDLNPLSDAGAAYVFIRTAGVWNQELKLTPNSLENRGSYNYFGTGLSVVQDVVNKTFTIGIGAAGHGKDTLGNNQIPGAGAVFLFD